MSKRCGHCTRRQIRDDSEPIQSLPLSGHTDIIDFDNERMIGSSRLNVIDLSTTRIVLSSSDTLLQCLGLDLGSAGLDEG